jgi:hypothetical protein
VSSNEPTDWRILTDEQKFALVNRVLFRRFSDEMPAAEEIWLWLEKFGYCGSDYHPLAGPVTITLARSAKGAVESFMAICFPNYYEGLLKVALRAEGLMIEDGLDEDEL